MDFSSMFAPQNQNSGAQQYQKNGQQSDQDPQTQLFKALLQQGMKEGAPQNSGVGGIAGNMLSKYMMMKAMSGMGGMTVNPGAAGAIQPMPDPNINLPTPGYTPPLD